MATTADMRKTLTDAYLTPAYFAVGLTDVAVEKMRDANLFDPEQLRRELSAQYEKVVKQVQEAPAMFFDRGRQLAEQAQAEYDVLAERGEHVVDRIMNQQATKDLKSQVDNTVSMTKGAMTSARNAVVETERAAVDTIKTGVSEAEGVAMKLAETARDDATMAGKSVRDATARTRAAATRTRKVAETRGKTASSRAKASATSARKTAAKASNAASAAAAKVGD
jgi:hypothetical protein